MHSSQQDSNLLTVEAHPYTTVCLSATRCLNLRSWSFSGTIMLCALFHSTIAALVIKQLPATVGSDSSLQVWRVQLCDEFRYQNGCYGPWHQTWSLATPPCSTLIVGPVIQYSIHTVQTSATSVYFQLRRGDATKMSADEQEAGGLAYSAYEALK